MNKYELYKLKVAGLSNLQVFSIVNYWEMNGEWPSLELMAKNCRVSQSNTFYGTIYSD